ncbi:MAG: glycosyltransferase [Merismopedia sp. SIO2A8]|nr:glycosyltransferase [Merismopedia sp. SIO2A8]
MVRDDTIYPRNQPILSVIIPHYNDLEALDRCLNLLCHQTCDRTLFEIIVVDNNSAVGLAAVQAVVGERATVITALEQGAAMARNAGVAAARGDIFAFIDSDCCPAPDWIENGWRAIANAKTPIVGGCVRTIPAQPDAPNPVEAFELVFAFKNEVYIKKVGFSVTANLFVQRAVFEHVGGFRQGLAEDKDWGLRAVEMGYAITYQPDVIVDHPARSNWSALAKKWKRLTHEEYLLRRANHLGTINWFTYMGLILISPLLHSIQVLQFQGLRPMVKLNVIAVLFRIRVYRCVEAWRMWSGVLSVSSASHSKI